MRCFSAAPKKTGVGDGALAVQVARDRASIMEPYTRGPL
jgi:hypothetical protein